MKELTETVHWELFTQAGFYTGLRSPGAASLTGCDIRKGSKRGTVSHSFTCPTLTHHLPQPTAFFQHIPKRITNWGAVTTVNL